MFIVFSLLLCLNSLPAAEGYKGPKKKLHIYLLIGQSNMAGRANYTEKEKAEIPNCYLLNKEDKWEAAKNPLNQHSSIRKHLRMQRMNPGYLFAKTMLKKDKSISLGLVVNAKGGTRVAQWKKGTLFFKEAVRRTKIAMKKGELKGILWHQGEGDSTNKNYLTELKQFVSDLREALGDKKVPFVVGHINSKNPKDSKMVNGFLTQLTKELDKTACVSSEGLVCKDRWHFNSDGMRKLGTRYAEAMLKLLPAADSKVKLKETLKWLQGLSKERFGKFKLEKLKKIKKLNLKGLAVNDKNIKHLRSLIKLTDLNLSQTLITDKGLENLYSLSSLVDLKLTGTKTTKGGIELLRKEIPKCVVTKIKSKK